MAGYNSVKPIHVISQHHNKKLLILFRAVKRYAKKVKSSMKAKIRDDILAGVRYSVTTDEYTSTQNKRFSNVCLHPPTGRPLKLGMMRIYGSLPAKKAAADLKKKLNEYDIKEDHHTIANTTDGASMMKKMGREFMGIHQICHSHGIHLAGKFFCQIFFKKIFTNF